MESAPPRKKRRSKWDVSSAPPASRDGGGGGVVVADVLAAAQRAVAARQQPPPAQPHVQAAAAGSLQPGLSSPLGSLATMQAPEATVDINSCGSRARISLTKKATQTDIHRSTGAAVNVRGQFCAPGQKLPSGRDALHLQVTGETQEQVDNAVAMINQIIASAAGGGGPRSARLASYSHKISVGIDALSTRFQVVYKICGPNDSHLGHIRATGASACLVGRGAPGPAGYGSQEPLAILLTSSTEAGLRKALDLTESLLATVRSEYTSFLKTLGPHGEAALPFAPPPPTWGYPPPPPPHSRPPALLPLPPPRAEKKPPVLSSSSSFNAVPFQYAPPKPSVESSSSVSDAVAARPAAAEKQVGSGWVNHSQRAGCPFSSGSPRTRLGFSERPPPPGPDSGSTTAISECQAEEAGHSRVLGVMTGAIVQGPQPPATSTAGAASDLPAAPESEALSSAPAPNRPFWQV